MSEHSGVIRFADVEQTFGRADGGAVTALDGITFDIGRNEFLAVLGPSGCGKSTLLRLIAGLIFPTRGTVSIYDLAVTEPRDEIRHRVPVADVIALVRRARQCDLSAPPQIWARQRGR